MNEAPRLISKVFGETKTEVEDPWDFHD
jgi:hypothetical protein